MDWNSLAIIAQAVGLPIAGLALLVGAAQIIMSARTSSKEGALQAHRDYLKMCFDHPEFSSTEQFLINHPEEKLAELLSERSIAQVKYLWFLSVMLNSLEQIIEFVSAKGGWRTLAIDQVRYHYGAIEVVWYEWQPHYGSTLRGIVQDALDEGAYPSLEKVDRRQLPPFPSNHKN